MARARIGRTLLVSDDTQITAQVTRVAKRGGARRFLATPSWSAARTLLLADPEFDVVVCELPESFGEVQSLARALRDWQDACPHPTALVAVCSLKTRRDFADLKVAGFDQVIIKPLNDNILEHHLREYTARLAHFDGVQGTVRRAAPEAGPRISQGTPTLSDMKRSAPESSSMHLESAFSTAGLRPVPPGPALSNRRAEKVFAPEAVVAPPPLPPALRPTSMPKGEHRHAQPSSLQEKNAKEPSLIEMALNPGRVPPSPPTISAGPVFGSDLSTGISAGKTTATGQKTQEDEASEMGTASTPKPATPSKAKSKADAGALEALIQMSSLDGDAMPADDAAGSAALAQLSQSPLAQEAAQERKSASGGFLPPPPPLPTVPGPDDAGIAPVPPPPPSALSAAPPPPLQNTEAPTQEDAASAEKKKRMEDRLAFIMFES